MLTSYIQYELVCLCLLATLSCSGFVWAEEGSWQPLQQKQLEILAGSALDFSALFEAGPAGQHGQVMSREDGHLAFAETAQSAQRFMCASQPYGLEQGFPDHDTADRYARQLRMHGYNLARFHFVDNVLMKGRNKNFDFDPIQLDRLYYFMAALKREGIYWMVDALTSWNGAYGDVGANRWAKRRNVKLGLYYDAADRDHWKTLVAKLYASPNPYTKLTPLQDPALMGVILVNEGGLNPVLNVQHSEDMNQQFRDWLKKRYGSVEIAVRKWGGGKAELPPMEWQKSPRMTDAQRFYYAKQNENLAWMTAYFRSLGYKGLLSAYDNWFTLQDVATRSQLEWVDLHAYHDPPSSFVAPGSAIKQESSLPGAVGYIRKLAASRYWGKPLTVSEYDQPFWNKWRYESGLAMGAYASLQDWDLICRHGSGPIEFAYGAKKGSLSLALHPYDIGLDPVARAGETLAALLFLRGDVASSTHRVAIRLGEDYVFAQQGGIGQLADDITRMGLVTGLGLVWNPVKPGYTPVKSEMSVNPANAAPDLQNKIVSKAENIVNLQGNAWLSRLKSMRSAAILPIQNKSDETHMESDTGQIVLDSKQGILTVTTPKTEAVAFAGTLPSALPNLQIKAVTGPGLVALSSVDGKVLNKSARMLLIYATDARNSGMSFQDTEGKVLDKLGELPVRIRSEHLSLRVNNENSQHLKFYALGLNGERMSEIALIRTNGSIEAEIALNQLENGPTTYFELLLAN